MNLDLSEWTLIKTSQIDDDFEGFDDEMTFKLTDGSYYYQKNYKYVYFYAYRPKAKIYRNGYSKIIIVDGMNNYVEVEETIGIESKIINDFKGWSENAVFELQNGQIWKQDKYKYKYFYAYRPKATIVKVGSKYIMTVKGNSIIVKKIK